MEETFKKWLIIVFLFSEAQQINIKMLKCRFIIIMKNWKVF